MPRRGWVPTALAVFIGALAAAYFAPLGDWAAANPLPGQKWMQQHTGPALGVFALTMLVAGVLSWQRHERDQTAAVDEVFDPRTDGYLDDLRKRMKVIWIDEFLARSLERIVPAKLGFRERRDAISSPLRVVGTPDLTGITEMFADPRTARRLLLLGAPGAGKTTQLLHLAEHLLEDGDGPVPIVVSLSGSTWEEEPHRSGRRESKRTAKKRWVRWRRWRSKRAERARLAQRERAVDTAISWFAREIGRLYQVPSRKAELWLRADQSPIVLLLDGLDEIREAEDRRRFVETLSLLRSRLNTGMVVCCRTDEYFEFGGELEFGAAVEIMPLRPHDVDEYLIDAGTKLVSLRVACLTNPALMQLLDTPLNLTVAVLTYRGKTVDEDVVQALLSNELDHLWSSYLAEALPRQRNVTGETPFSSADALWYARGLAQVLEKAGRDSFNLDTLHLGWWDQRNSRTSGVLSLYLFAVILCVAMPLGRWAVSSSLELGGISVSVFVVSAVMYWWFAHTSLRWGGISRIERTLFVSGRWRLNWEAAGRTAGGVMTAGLTAGAVINLTRSFEDLDGWKLALIPACTAAFAAAVLALPDRAGPEMTSARSPAARRTLLVRLGASAVAPVGLVSVWFISPAVNTEWQAVLVHATVASILGVWLAGFTASLHGLWSHRATLRKVFRSDLLPLDISTFLEHLEERIVTRRRLDGYAFLHRTLQSYLVNLDLADRRSASAEALQASCPDTTA